MTRYPGRFVWAVRRGWMLWAILTVFFGSLACAFVAPIYGRALYDSSPTVAVEATGQVVEAVMSSRRGVSHPFFVTSLQWWVWSGLSFLVWAPLVACGAAVAWVCRPGWRD